MHEGHGPLTKGCWLAARLMALWLLFTGQWCPK